MKKNFSPPFSTPPQIPRNDISSRRNEVVKRGWSESFLDAAAVSKTGLRRMARAYPGWGRFDRFVFYDYVGINRVTSPPNN